MQIQVERLAILVMTFPSDDLVFAERVREALREAEHSDDAQEILEHRLRLVHPEVAIRQRAEAAGFGPSRVLYAFRDGSALPQHNTDDWIDDVSTARVVTDPTGAYLDANDQAARLFGVAREVILRSRAGAFTRPDARISDADALWQAFAKVGRLHSLAVVVRPDGTETPVEFVTVRDRDGPGRTVTVLRSLG